MVIAYSEQLKSPLWQKRRLQILDLSNWQCTNCGDKSKQLHVHHRQYFKGRKVWEYEDHELVVLCQECHEDEHEIADELKKVLTLVESYEALALLVGYADKQEWPEPWLGDIGRDRDPYLFACGVIAGAAQFLNPDKLKEVANFIYEISTERGREHLRRNFPSEGL